MTAYMTCFINNLPHWNLPVAGRVISKLWNDVNPFAREGFQICNNLLEGEWNGRCPLLWRVG